MAIHFAWERHNSNTSRWDYTAQDGGARAVSYIVITAVVVLVCLVAVAVLT